MTVALPPGDWKGDACTRVSQYLQHMMLCLTNNEALKPQLHCLLPYLPLIHQLLTYQSIISQASIKPSFHVKKMLFEIIPHQSHVSTSETRYTRFFKKNITPFRHFYYVRIFPWKSQNKDDLHFVSAAAKRSWRCDLNGNPDGLRAGLESRMRGGVIDAIVDCNIDRWVEAVGWNNGV